MTELEKADEPQMNTAQAMSTMKKIVHSLRVYKDSIEALEVARREQGRLGDLIAEGDALVVELREMKGEKRTEAKKIENLKEVVLRTEQEVRGKVDEAREKAEVKIRAAEEKSKAETKELQKLILEARTDHFEKLKDMKEERGNLQAEVDTLTTMKENILSQLEKMRA